MMDQNAEGPTIRGGGCDIWIAILALFSAVGSGCGLGDSCGDVTDEGNAAVVVPLLPESQVTPPESFLVASPIYVTGTISAYDQVTSADPAGTTTSGPFVLASINEDVNTGRSLIVSWGFVDLDRNNPPSDQFDATVTDAGGQVTGKVALIGEPVWAPATTCVPGHWIGPKTFSAASVLRR